MSVSPIDSTTSTPATAEVKFNAAVDKSKSEMSDDELTEALITQAVTIGGQFIIMPKAQEMLNEAQSSEDDEE
ncbi:MULTISPECIES: hypothetical protein [Pseudomonas]|jgi:hypothetical protein|uniref:Uncharacterized protein n=1 Tax=Pseudomonas lutea TaxID=243924 RepID=A0A9X0EG47_9PSED|nr:MULTISPECIES: hypothetical protein [Pseudomonas]KGF65134.1 hypothetical protein LT42_04030 [Pseudomonas lutea]